MPPRNNPPSLHPGSKSSRQIQTDLPTFTGQVPYQVEQAILLLRQSFDDHINALHARIDNLPPPLTLPQIQQELSPTGSYPLPTAALLNTAEPPTGGTPVPGPPVEDGIPNFLTEVQAAATSIGVDGTTSDEQMFRFIQTAVQNINASGNVPSGLLCGLTLAPATGSNVFTCAGTTYRYGRLTFSNDHSFDVLIDADPGGARTPQWSDNGITPGLYSVATSPSDPC